jgi:RNA polymerase sigma-70 factor (ECF subfamily)
MNPSPLRALKGGMAAAEMTDLSDDDLMLLVRTGIEAAFEILIRRHQGVVLAYAIRFLGDRSLARETTQEVFLALWTERERYQAMGRFRSYLLMVTHHRCQALARTQRYDQARRHGAQEEAEALGARGPETPLDQLLEASRRSELGRLLGELDEGTRAALILRYVNELGYEEMARVTGRPEGTLKAQVCRGLRRLHERVAGG